MNMEDSISKFIDKTNIINMLITKMTWVVIESKTRMVIQRI